jgi:putative thioredoxin
VDATDETFETAVVARSRDVPVVVDFWAEWCGPCRALTPVLEREVASRGGTVELAKVDVDANPVLSDRFRVSGIPAVKAFRDGRVVAEFVGARSPAAVSAFLDELLAPPRSDVLIEELRASGELPEVLAALDRDDPEPRGSAGLDRRRRPLRERRAQGAAAGDRGGAVRAARSRRPRGRRLPPPPRDRALLTAPGYLTPGRRTLSGASLAA